MRALLTFQLFIICLTCLRAESYGQEAPLVLSEQEFMDVLNAFHPVSKAAALRVQRAEAGIMEARGSFDPKAEGGLDRKEFGGKTYYDYRSAQLSIPTWYGFNIKTGIEDASGEYLSNETTKGRVSYAGISLSLNELLFDRRRAAVRQAQAFRQQTDADQQLALNELFYDGLSAYWDWVRLYRNYAIISEAVRVNEERIRFVRLEADQGARPYIDTTEALTQLQSLQLQQQELLASWTQAGWLLSTFLWTGEGTPYNWQPMHIVPPSQEADPTRVLQPEFFNAQLATLRENHPKLRSLAAKLQSQQIDRRLKAQYLLPKLEAGANVLNRGNNISENWSSTLLEQNNKINLSLSIPLFMRAARGAYKASQIKISETQLETDQAALELESKLRNAYILFNTLSQQVSTSEALLENYRRLLRGEMLRYETGESTLFLINSRESKMLEGAQKVAELKAKQQKAYAAFFAAAAQLAP